jgi:hypothetical protein
MANAKSYDVSSLEPYSWRIDLPRPYSLAPELQEHSLACTSSKLVNTLPCHHSFYFRVEVWVAKVTARAIVSYRHPTSKLPQGQPHRHTGSH